MIKYSEMKDSGIEWIGEIPGHWSLKKIKFLFWERKEKNNPIKSENLISLTIEKGVIPHSEKTGGGNKPKEDLTKYKLVYPGDIVLNSMNVIAGAVGISNYFGVVSPVYYMLIARDFNHFNEFYHHMFRNETFQKSLYGLGNGILIKESEKSGKLNTIRMRIPMDKLGDQYIPTPPLEEQKRISKYLDQKTEQIDSLIEKIEKKIELLKEQRTSLINQCVTKGLDPNVEMKDSGIEWIGEIPSHWEVKKFKHSYRFGMGETILKENLSDIGIPVLSATEEYTHFGFVEKPKLQLGIGDIVIPARGNSIGHTKKIRETSTTTQTTIYGKPTSLVDCSFTTYYCNGQRERLFQFDRTAIPQITVDQVQNNNFLYPPLEEQKRISKYLDQKTEQIDSLVNSENNRIKLLKEYRQSLISSVVTGKVRVTEGMVS